MSRAPRAPSATSASGTWYRDGLRFQCTACGKCCTGVPGYVWVTEAEVERMARFLKVPLDRFLRQNVRRVGKRLSLIERTSGDCVLLKDGRCTVYPVKPGPCSTFPFWDGPLADEASWKEAAQRCEGIGLGDVYPLEEIERIRAGDPAPLIERHAAAARRAAEAASTGQASASPAPGSAAPGSVAPGSVAPGSLVQDPARAPALEAALADLEALYADLDRELPKHRFTCAASGKCCDFDAYGHRLYVTTLEAEWFFRHAPEQRANQDPRACPAWGPDRLCKARTARMLGCRTYFCGPYPNGRPEDVHAPFHRRVQLLHEKHGIPYQYRDITDWARERRPARAEGPTA